MSTSTHARSSGGEVDGQPGGARMVMLGIATVGFAVNFWAWALLGPLGPRFKESLGLSCFQQALAVAVPVIVGSIGRIPVGALTDRYGGRVMFPAVSLVTVAPVLFLSHFHSYAALLAGGFFLTIASIATFSAQTISGAAASSTGVSKSMTFQ